MEQDKTNSFRGVDRLMAAAGLSSSNPSGGYTQNAIERRRAMNNLERMKALEEKFRRKAAKGKATCTTTPEVGGMRVSFHDLTLK